ncbi:MAG: hypothetical protein R2991_00845 [Thermoanaerobaculia bacterium]
MERVLPQLTGTRCRLPSRPSIRDLLAGSPTLWVPGHGPLADRAAVERLLAVVDALADHAVDAHRRGLDAAAAAESFHLPQVAADWTLFSPSYFEVAIGKARRARRAG